MLLLHEYNSFCVTAVYHVTMATGVSGYKLWNHVMCLRAYVRARVSSRVEMNTYFSHAIYDINTLNNA